MTKIEMILDHEEQIKALKIQRNIACSIANNAAEFRAEYEDFEADILAYEEDIKLLNSEL